MNETREATIPANIQAEYAVLAFLLTYPRKMAEVADMLLPEHFHDHRYRSIYETIAALHTQGKIANKSNMLDELEMRGEMENLVPPHTERVHEAVEYLLDDFANSLVVIQTVFADEVEKVIFTGTMRRVLEVCQHGADMAYHRDTNTLAWMEQSLYEEIATGANTKPVTPLREAIDRYLAEYEIREEARKEGKPGGIPTGFADVDHLLGGLRKSRLYTLFGSTGGGKTAFALNIGLNIVAHARHVLFFSLEMDEDELVQRLLAMETHIDQALLRDGGLDPSEKMQMQTAARRLRGLDLSLDDRTYTLSAIRTKARATHRAKPLDLIVVDYLGLIEPEENGAKRRDGQRYLEMGELSRGLKRLARELKVPVLALGQLNRASAHAEEPQLEHIYESSKIAQDSDVVLFAHVEQSQQDARNSSLPYRVNLIVRKHRNGRIGRAELWFRPRLTKFEDKEWQP